MAYNAEKTEWKQWYISVRRKRGRTAKEALTVESWAATAVYHFKSIISQHDDLTTTGSVTITPNHDSHT